MKTTTAGPRARDSPAEGTTAPYATFQDSISVKMGLLAIQAPTCPQTADGDTGTG